MKTRIHVNQHNIRANSKGAELPVFTVKTYKENKKCNGLCINGPSTLVYSPDKPLSCGAKVWIETEAEVVCHPDPDKTPTVGELIETLQTMPKDFPVYVCNTRHNDPIPIDLVDTTISDRVDFNFQDDSEEVE